LSLQHDVLRSKLHSPWNSALHDPVQSAQHDPALSTAAMVTNIVVGGVGGVGHDPLRSALHDPALSAVHLPTAPQIRDPSCARLSPAPPSRCPRLSTTRSGRPLTLRLSRRATIPPSP